MSKYSMGELKRLYKKHHGVHSRIAEELGLSRERVRQIYEPTDMKATNMREASIYLAENEREIKRMAKKLTLREVSRRYKIPYKTLQQWSKDNRVEFAKYQAPKKYSDAFLITLYKKYKNYSHMARELGIAPTNVSRMFRDRGLVEKYPSQVGRPS